MPNIRADLVLFNNEIGPQYLDTNDKSGGPDGTMKPITLDVLREMFIQNFPELQNVKDSDVKLELTNIRSLIQSQEDKTKNVTGTVGINNFPSNQDVTDAQVKAMLEVLKTQLQLDNQDIKTELQLVKQELQTIKDKTHNVQVTGSLTEIYGKNESDRPQANKVTAGTTFTVVNKNLDTWISDGQDWKVL